MKQKRAKVSEKILLYSVVLMVALGMASSSWATNGMFSHGYSLKNKALAGAGTALPLDSVAASANPAGMVYVGNRADVGISFFNPIREYTASASPFGPGGNLVTPGNYDSDSEWFAIPVLGFNWMIDDDSSIGVSIFGNGGMNTDYDTATYAGGTVSTGVDYMQLFIAPTYARKVMPKHSIGITPIIAYQRFEAKGLAPFAGFSSSSADLTDNGHDSAFGYGVRVGYLGEIMPGVSIGASYQTKIYMDEFDDYKGLFAEQGDMDVPPNWSVGVAVDVTPEIIITADVQGILYDEIDAINNPLLPNLMPGTLGNNNGAGFGWEDMTVFKIGVQWQSSPEWTWRAGFSTGDQPIPSSETLFNIIAPGVIEEHVTFGFTRKIDDNQSVDFAMMHALENDVKGTTPASFGAQTVELEMKQWEFSLGYSYKF